MTFLPAESHGRLPDTISGPVAQENLRAGMPDDIEYARGDLLAIYRGAKAEQFGLGRSQDSLGESDGSTVGGECFSQGLQGADAGSRLDALSLH